MADFIHSPVILGGLRVLTGDVLDVAVGRRLRLHLAGIETPQFHQAGQQLAAMVARAHVRKWLGEAERGGHRLIVRVPQSWPPWRLEGDIYLYREECEESLAAYLLAVGVAVVREPGRRHHWTDEELRAIEATAP